jgi:hypothetical protein
MAGQFSVSHNFTPFIDTRLGIPATERYKAVGGTAFDTALQKKYGPCGMHAFVSADAIRWKRLRDEPIIPGAWGMFDSQNVVFWSENEGQYVAYFRYFLGRRRAIRRSTSKDFLHWTKPVEVGTQPMSAVFTLSIKGYLVQGASLLADVLPIRTGYHVSAPIHAEQVTVAEYGRITCH